MMMPLLCVYCHYRKDKDSDKGTNTLSCFLFADEDSYWYSRALSCKEYPLSCLNYVITDLHTSLFITILNGSITKLHGRIAPLISRLHTWMFYYNVHYTVVIMMMIMP